MKLNRLNINNSGSKVFTKSFIIFKTLRTFSSFFHIPFGSSNSVISVSGKGCVGFSSFVAAFCRHYKVTLASLSAERTLLVLLCAYFFLPLFCKSSFAMYLRSKNRSVLLPQFLFNLISRFSVPVNSRNKFAGYTRGEVDSSETFESIKLTIKGLGSENSDLSFLDGTLFSNLTSERRRLDSLRSSLLHFTDSIEGRLPSNLSSAEIEFEFLIRISSLIGEIIMNRETFREVNILLPYDQNPNLGMFRFRNTKVNTEYVCTQVGLDSLSNPTIDYLSCLLKLFTPDIKHQGVDSTTTQPVLPGECIFRVSDVSEEEFWFYLLAADTSDGSVDSETGLNDDASLQRPSRNGKAKKEVSKLPINFEKTVSALFTKIILGY